MNNELLSKIDVCITKASSELREARRLLFEVESIYDELTSKIKDGVEIAVTLLRGHEIDYKVFDLISGVRFDFDDYDLEDKLDIINKNINNLDEAIKIIDDKLMEPMLPIVDGVCIKRAESELREARRLLIKICGHVRIKTVYDIKAALNEEEQQNGQ